VFFNFDSILLLLPCVGFLCGSMFVTLCSKHAVTSCFRHSESLIECEAPFTSSLIGLRIRASPQVSADVVGGVSKGNHSFSTKRGGTGTNCLFCKFLKHQFRIVPCVWFFDPREEDHAVLSEVPSMGRCKLCQ
jgi:hypothetical protein